MIVVAVTPADGDVILPLDAAKRHLKIDVPDAESTPDPDAEGDDAEIRAFRDAAIDWIETYTGRALQRRVFRWSGASLDMAVSLPIRPVRSVSSVGYLADDIVMPIAADAYRVVGDGIVAASSAAWLTVQCAADGARVDFDAGYDVDLPLPAALMAAIKMLMGHLYRNRGATNTGATVTEVPFGVETLCQAYRVWRLV
jgi:uncharacterized phiE125 gp8 family phage protein